MLAALQKSGISMGPIRVRYEETPGIDLRHYVFQQETSQLAKLAARLKVPNKINVFFGHSPQSQLTGFCYGKSWGTVSMLDTVWLTQNIYLTRRGSTYSSVLAHELAHIVLDRPYHEGENHILAPLDKRSDSFKESQIKKISRSYLDVMPTRDL